MKIPMSAFSSVVEVLLRSESRSVTKFLAADCVVRATHTHRPDKRSRSTSLVVTFGKPNYREREFVKACRVAGEPFPVRKIQMRAWPKRCR